MRLTVMLAVLSLTGCGLTPSQKFGVIAGVLIVGAIAAHGQDSGKPLVPGVPTPSVDCASNPESCR